jgi:hypothetical protein
MSKTLTQTVLSPTLERPHRCTISVESIPIMSSKGVRTFAQQIVALIGEPPGAPVVGLHKNTQAGPYSINSYTPSGNLAHAASNVYVNRQKNEHDLAFTPVPLYSDKLKVRGNNVALQSDTVTDDVSLSVCCTQKRIPYVNIDVPKYSCNLPTNENDRTCEIDLSQPRLILLGGALNLGPHCPSAINRRIYLRVQYLHDLAALDAPDNLLASVPSFTFFSARGLPARAQKDIAVYGEVVISKASRAVRSDIVPSRPGLGVRV